MIFKWIILLAVVFLVFWLFRPFQRRQKHSADTAARAAENMVRCAYCGVHHPESESITGNGHNFCCAEHSRLYSQSRSRRE